MVLLDFLDENKLKNGFLGQTSSPMIFCSPLWYSEFKHVDDALSALIFLKQKYIEIGLYYDWVNKVMKIKRIFYPISYRWVNKVKKIKRI